MRVHLDSLGCRLNQSEIESLGRQFRAAGNDLVATPEQSDLVVINTCTVTRDAAAASRARIRPRPSTRAGCQDRRDRLLEHAGGRPGHGT